MRTQDEIITSKFLFYNHMAVAVSVFVTITGILSCLACTALCVLNMYDIISSQVVNWSIIGVCAFGFSCIMLLFTANTLSSFAEQKYLHVRERSCNSATAQLDHNPGSAPHRFV